MSLNMSLHTHTNVSVHAYMYETIWRLTVIEETPEKFNSVNSVSAAVQYEKQWRDISPKGQAWASKVKKENKNSQHSGFLNNIDGSQLSDSLLKRLAILLSDWGGT